MLAKVREGGHYALMILWLLGPPMKSAALTRMAHQLLVGLALAGLGGFCLNPWLAQARQYAVLADPSGARAVPEVSMQQLQAEVLEHLQGRFDFSLQPTFEQEQARLKSDTTAPCADDSCAVDALKSLPGAHLFWIRHKQEEVRVFWRGPDRQYQTFRVQGGAPETITLQVLQQLPFLENHVVAVSPERLQKVPQLAVTKPQPLGLKEADAESKPEATVPAPRSITSTKVANTNTTKHITDALRQKSLQPTVVAKQPTATAPIESEEAPLPKQVAVKQTQASGAEEASLSPATDSQQKWVAAFVPQPQPAPQTRVRLRKPLNALDKLRFRVAEKRYNQTIWQQIKIRLLFFRKLNKLGSAASIEARIRLSIDPSGRVVERMLLFPSQSRFFNQELMKAVDALELPPPQEVLVRNPPYVVNITLKL